MTFGAFIKYKRINKGFTLRAFAEEIGITPSYLHDIEYGRRAAPGDEKLDKIIHVLNIDGDELNILHDLAAETRNDIPKDVKDFLMENKDVIKHIRNLRDKEV